MKIYTKTGDCGETSLYGGKRVFKSNTRIDSYGGVDELNSLIGLVTSKLVIGNSNDERIKSFLTEIQGDLFLIGGNLAGSPLELTVLPERVEEMEKLIDELSTKLPELNNFILPGGGELGSLSHLARSVTRRVERQAVKLSQEEDVDKRILIYLNRLSDLFFTLARYFNLKDNKEEIIWYKA
ncbi:MAG: ATP/cobalamin adenosyltransferase [Candidatus Gottesmanbacteria bacterium GW2011_GWA2_41_12]|uniref:Corrinoid adenosyltransferase n=2 Tax=Candidatus Gottesmaniibacteriota TaxID=1752720 RepID=A0A0G0UHZ6_9BACT|nr:MAG: ATP/cobalamin adenosyltransferase [Candidatus Gottesmanbacteria bacterium GW2011_GWC2_39_8]KKR88459.1 MAG: ATP/cobalamin adenosyltransferase [Candidatus Gottesmanbacteria bacterium GW2011_GWA2_41_12]